MNTQGSIGSALRTIKRKRLAILFAVLVAGLLLVLWHGTGGGNGAKAARGSFVDSDNMSEVIVGGRTFAFPRRYFWGFMGGTSGHAKTVNLMALLPDIEAYSETNKAEFTDCLGFCRRVYISINESIEPWHFTQYSKELVEWSRMTPLDPEKARNSYSGLRYLNLISPDKTSVWESHPDEGYFFDCSPLRTPKPSCTVIMDYDERVYVETTFSKDYLTELPQIVARVKTFLMNHQKQKGAE